MDQKYYFTSDAGSVLSGIVADMPVPVRKVLAVTGKSSYEKSGAKDVIDALGAGDGIEIYRFADFAVNPQYEDLQRGLELINSIRPDFVVAIGGGSVIDMAKLLRFYYSTRNPDLGDVNPGNHIPLIAIPTTAGTGSEATHFAVLYKDGKKTSVADRRIMPDYAVIDPSLTYGLSAYVTACTGFDALAQAIEAYWNRNATDESDEFALKAIDLLWETLPEVCVHPTPGLRRRMSEGAYWAGRAINITKTTAPHAFSYPFTSHYGYPHGHAVALCFPQIAEYNFKSNQIPQRKIIIISEHLNLLDQTIYDCMSHLILSLGLTLSKNIDYDIDLIMNGINIERLSNNPARIDKTSSKDLLLRIIRTS